MRPASIARFIAEALNAARNSFSFIARISVASAFAYFSVITGRA